MSDRESALKGNVTSKISVFENGSAKVSLSRSRSMLTVSKSPPLVRVAQTESVELTENYLELAQIEQQIQHLQRSLTNTYKNYSKETHIYYQNQIIFLLTDLGSLDTRNDTDVIDKKSELGELLKRLNKKLNAILPSSVVTRIPPAVIKISGDQADTSTPQASEAGEYFKRTGLLLWSARSVPALPTWKMPSLPAVDKSRPVEPVDIPQVREQTNRETYDENADSVRVSVCNLRQVFERNKDENERPAHFGPGKISKYSTFNGADSKYVPFHQRLGQANGSANGTDSISVSSEVYDVLITPESSDEETLNGDENGDLD